MQLLASKFEMAKFSLQLPQILYSLFLAAIIIDVGGSFGLKYASFFIIVGYLLFSIAIQKKEIKIPFSFLILEGGLFFIAPLVFLTLAIAVFSVKPSAALMEITPFGIWLLYPLFLLIRPKEKIISLFTNALFFGAILIIIIFCTICVFHFFGQNEMIQKIYIFSYEHNLGYFGIKPFNETNSLFFPNVYPRWTLLLIPAAVLLMKDNGKKFIIVALATLLTTSTAAILFMICGIFWVCFNRIWAGKISKQYAIKFILVISIIFVFISVVYFLKYTYILEHIITKFEADSPSTSVKIGHIHSILNYILSDPVILLVGMGVGSTFWSIGTSSYVSNVEVSHFNLIRQFGLPYAMVFFLYVFVLFSRLYKLNDEIGRPLAIGLMTLFVAAGTNPLLLSPIFFLVMVISRAYITLIAREQRQSRIAHTKSIGGKHI